MDSFNSLLNNVMDILNIKYSFDIESSDFKPELIFTFGELTPPKEEGKKDGDSRGTGLSKMFWFDKGGIWMPKDLFNGTRSVSGESANLKSMSLDDKKILLDKISEIKGELDPLDFVKHSADLYKELFKATTTPEQTKLQKEIKESLNKYVSQNSAAIESRNKVLRNIDDSFGSDVAQGIKRVVLRSKSLSKIMDTLEKGIAEKQEGYEPKLDKNQTELNKKDRQYILGLIKKYHKEGMPSIIKKLIGKYPKKILEDLNDASEKYGDIKGVAKYLDDYEDLKEDLSKWQGLVPNSQPGRSMPEINGLVKPVLDFINKVKKTLDIPSYDSTFLAYTENVLEAIKAYGRSNKRIPEFEWAIVDILGGQDSDKRESLVSAWRDAKVPGITKIVSELPRKLSDTFDFTKYEVSEKEFFNNPDRLYKNLKNMEGKPKYLKDILDLRNKPVKFEQIVVEDDEGNTLDDASRLNLEDQEFIDQVKKLLKEDKKEKIKEIKEEGLTPEELKERSKNYKDTVKNENRENLLKNINEIDSKELDLLENKFEERKKQITELRKKLRGLKKLDETSLKTHLTDLKKTLSESEEDQKIVKKIIKLEEQLRSVGTMTDKQKEDLRKDIEEIEGELEKSVGSKDGIQKMLKRFKDMDSWIKDIDKKQRDVKKQEKQEKNREIDLSELPDAQVREYLQRFEDAMIVNYINKFPEIMYKFVPDDVVEKKIQKAEKDLKQIQDKESKNKKDEKDIAELKLQIDKLDKNKNKKVLRDDDEAVEEIKKLRERLQAMHDGKKLMITPEDYLKYVAEAKLKDAAMRKILEKAKVDFENMMKEDKIIYKLKDYQDKKEKPRNLTREAPTKEKEDTKKSHILDKFSETIYYKIDKLANNAPNEFIKAELMSISSRIKDLL